MAIKGIKNYSIHQGSICFNIKNDEISNLINTLGNIYDNIFGDIPVGDGRSPRVRDHGVSFNGTNFHGMSELDVSSIHFEKNSNLRDFVEPYDSYNYEYLTETRQRIDGVFIKNDQITTIVEVQSGIQHGDYLDDEHWNKSFGSYYYSQKTFGRANHIVVIAGGFSNEILTRTNKWVEDKKNPPKVTLLKTAIVDGKIILEKVDF